jgi:hypothetical protein
MFRNYFREAASTGIFIVSKTYEIVERRTFLETQLGLRIKHTVATSPQRQPLRFHGRNFHVVHSAGNAPYSFQNLMARDVVEAPDGSFQLRSAV